MRVGRRNEKIRRIKRTKNERKRTKSHARIISRPSHFFTAKTLFSRARHTFSRARHRFHGQDSFTTQRMKFLHWPWHFSRPRLSRDTLSVPFFTPETYTLLRFSPENNPHGRDFFSSRPWHPRNQAFARFSAYKFDTHTINFENTTMTTSTTNKSTHTLQWMIPNVNPSFICTQWVSKHTKSTLEC